MTAKGPEQMPMTNAEKQAAFRARQAQKAAATQAELAAALDQLKAARAQIVNLQYRLNGLTTVVADQQRQIAQHKAQERKRT
jgi:ABC-type transporter Mla subunit MlaD